MGVEGYDAAVQRLCLLEGICLPYQPLEDGQAVLAQPFRMPLYAQYALVLRALNRLNYAVRSCGDGAETFSRVIDSLMVERIDVQFE